jgi:integral membrane sensor domain MASE1
MKNIFISLPRAIKLIIVAAVYFVLAVASLRFSYHYSNATPIWPPSGFAFAILLLAGTSVAPGIFIGAFAANLFVFITNQTCPPVAATMASASYWCWKYCRSIGWFLFAPQAVAFC